ncbi:MAG: type II secretion system protein GspJ [Candidatus Binatia bacterium]
MKIRISNLKFQIGFTLIEVTIAMTLFALMAMILYGAFYLGHRAVEKTTARSEKSQRLRSGEELLAGYVRSAYPYRSSRKDPSIFFSGGEDRLTFISALSVGMGGRGMSEVSISWDGEGDGAGLLILEEKTPVRLEPQGDGAGYRNSVVLRQGVRDFHIDYLDSRSEEESWVEQWDGEERKILPRAVRLSLQEEGGKEVQWVFPIMMSVLAP